MFRILGYLRLFLIEGPRSRCYGRTAARRLIVQPCDEDDDEFFFVFPFYWSTDGMKLTGENCISDLVTLLGGRGYRL
jgi:hypothetical protein